MEGGLSENAIAIRGEGGNTVGEKECPGQARFGFDRMRNWL